MIHALYNACCGCVVQRASIVLSFNDIYVAIAEHMNDVAAVAIVGILTIGRQLHVYSYFIE